MPRVLPMSAINVRAWRLDYVDVTVLPYIYGILWASTPLPGSNRTRILSASRSCGQKPAQTQAARVTIYTWLEELHVAR